MHTDPTIGRDRSVCDYRHPLLEKLSPYLRSLDGLSDPVARRRVRWTPLASALAAILMALDVGCSLKVRFQDALACLGIDFRRSRRLGRSYNGLLKALLRQAPAVLPPLKADLRSQAKAMLAHLPRVQGWTLLAVDGSKEDLPRTRSLEDRFGIADNGKCPQALVTVIVEVFTGLLWDWRVTRGRGSERGLLIDMVEHLPAGSLLLGDGNFVGYPVWSCLVRANRAFLVRVGGNVSLLRQLCPQTRLKHHRDIVYVWPVNHQHASPPLQLRLITVRAGQDFVYLITNVLDRRRLTDKAAGEAYRRRWGVELFYRTLKRTLGYAKLRSRSGARTAVEMEWGLITMCVVVMMGIGQLHRRQVDLRRLSAAVLLEGLRASLLRGGTPRSPRRARRALDEALRQAVQDNYRRRAPKHSRHRPVTRNTPFPQRLKPPRIRIATAEERQRARQMANQWAA